MQHLLDELYKLSEETVKANDIVHGTDGTYPLIERIKEQLEKIGYNPTPNAGYLRPPDWVIL